MIKAVVLMMFVCVIMVQSATETLTGVTLILCAGADNCTDDACEKNKELTEIPDVTCGKDGTVTYEDKNAKYGVCETIPKTDDTPQFSYKVTWTGGCLSAIPASGSIEVATTALFSIGAILFL